MSFNHTGAVDRALDIVKAGLESGAIKLQGSSAYAENNQEQVKMDAQYLNSLLNSLVDNLSAQGRRD